MKKQRKHYSPEEKVAILSQHLLDCKLSDEDEPLKICGHKPAEIFGSVVDEGLRREDAGVIDDMINRAKLFDGSPRDLLSRLCLADIPVDKS